MKSLEVKKIFPQEHFSVCKTWREPVRGQINELNN